VNIPRAMYYLLAAVQHARHACERTRQMVANAIAALMARMAIAKAATL
jgi:hypothetical protein